MLLMRRSGAGRKELGGLSTLAANHPTPIRRPATTLLRLHAIAGATDFARGLPSRAFRLPPIPRKLT